jgi:hypothetical protein
MEIGIVIPVFAGAIALLALLIQFFWKSESTIKHKVAIRLFIGFALLFIILTLWSILKG